MKNGIIGSDPIQSEVSIIVKCGIPVERIIYIVSEMWSYKN